MKTKLKFECKKGHVWWALPGNIYQGSWCSSCGCKREDACRDLFVLAFGVPFTKSYPKWLRNPPTGRLLELDGYNIELGIAFEYQGRQHYETVEWFDITHDDLVKMKQRDAYKVKMCAEMGVKLIVIPYWIRNLRKFISKEIGRPIPMKDVSCKPLNRPDYKLVNPLLGMDVDRSTKKLINENGEWDEALDKLSKFEDIEENGPPPITWEEALANSIRYVNEKD